jgi:hypothetical protein
MDKKQRQAIRKFETWQHEESLRVTQKRVITFSNPIAVAKPTPRSSRDAWGGTYTNEDDDRRQEKYTTWAMYAFVFAYIAFLVWREIP